MAGVLSVGWHAIWRRRAGLLWWSVGLAGTLALLAAAYPTVRDNGELDKTFAGLPPGPPASPDPPPGLPARRSR